MSETSHIIWLVITLVLIILWIIDMEICLDIWWLVATFLVIVGWFGLILIIGNTIKY